VVGTVREYGKIPIVGGNVSYIRYSVDEAVSKLVEEVEPSVVFNCIVHKSSRLFNYRVNLKKSIEINSIFPRRLQGSLRNKNTFVFNFSSDAVFSGKATNYTENHISFPRSIYGLSKYLGETESPKGLLLRLSFVTTKKDLCSQQNHLSARIIGAHYSEVIQASHEKNWNGLPVQTVSQILTQLCLQNYKPTGTRHLFTSTPMSRYELSQRLSKHFGRDDLLFETKKRRTNNSILSTSYPDDHAFFWSLIGRSHTPSFDQLLDSE
jgi:dTDP-4-dehydrorhamnose reductase